MASKTERALVVGTDNVYDLAQYRALKLVGEYRDEFPWVNAPKDTGVRTGLDNWFRTKYLEHNERMLIAAARTKARKEFIDETISD